MPRRRGTSREVLALGIVTITAYGSWMYGYGVLIDAIRDDTGWSTTLLGVTYGIAQAITAVGAFFGGRLLDRVGASGPFGLQATLGAGLLLGATWTTQPWAFALAYGLGGGIVGATGFYHVTTVVAARSAPDEPERAIASLTIVGAFSSPIYLPLTTWMLSSWHWRSVGRALAASCLAGALVGLTAVRSGKTTGAHGPSPKPLAAIRKALASRPVRNMLIGFVTTWIAFSSVIVYQVPILTASGLTLGTAGVVAGLRGLCQILGRVGLIRAVNRFGSGALLRAAYWSAAVGLALLPVGSLVAGVAFAVIAGAAIGATSPLQAIHARNRFDADDLGLLMGMQGAAAGLAGALGPIFGAVIHDSAGSWNPTVLMGIAGLVVGGILIGSGDANEVARD